ncbi:MAG: IMP cyclohydrolase [Oscillospiraceae bacterium]|nr:IMP cyclohydrolase [Oscillospiraceae bacterium]
MKTIGEILSNNSYPGRGILIGITEDNLNVAIGYFIMGRSENSRNRIFALNGEDLKTKPFDESKLADPNLIIYSPVRTMGGITIVTNGDQTDTIYDGLKQGISFEESLQTRTFEPDAPNFTPRISAIVNLTDISAEYKLSILKSANHNKNSTQRFFFEYKQPIAGEGHLIHTYKHDGDPIPSFCGEPHTVKIEGNLKEFGDAIWNALNKDNRISLFTRFINIKAGLNETRIINKNF